MYLHATVRKLWDVGDNERITPRFRCGQIIEKNGCENKACLFSGSVTTDGSTLTLLRLSPEDSGTYTCLAVNSAGQESKIYTVFALGWFFTPSLCLSASGF